MKEWQPNSGEFREALARIQVVIIYPQVGPEILVLDLRRPPGPEQITTPKKTDVLTEEQIQKINATISANMSVTDSENIQLRNSVLLALGREGLGVPFPVFSNYVTSLIEPTPWATVVNLFSSRIDVESLQNTANRLERDAFRRDLLTGGRETGGYKIIWQSPKSAS